MGFWWVVTVCRLIHVQEYLILFYSSISNPLFFIQCFYCKLFSQFRKVLIPFFCICEIFMKKYLKFHQNHSIIDRHWRRIEVAITSLTRNQVVGQPAHGFESHRLRYTNWGCYLRVTASFLFSMLTFSYFQSIIHHFGFFQESFQPPITILYTFLNVSSTFRLLIPGLSCNSPS